jgi:O-antigen/teichoic acid export membrane protein
MIRHIKNKTALLRDDPHMREVARGTLLAFVLKVGGSAIAFTFNVVVARLLGAEGAGLYFLALSISTIGAVIGSVGLNNSLLRFVATYATHKDWGNVKAVHALGMRIAIAASGGLSVAGFILAPWLSDALFHKPLLAEPLRWMSLSILPFALLNLHAQSLKGLKHLRDAMMIQGIGVPFVSLALIWPLANFAGLKGVVWAYLAATVLLGLLGHWAWHRALASHNELPAPYSLRELWVSCKSLLIVSLAGEAILPFAPILLLGIWASSEEVGVFGAANRVAMLVSFLLVTVNNVTAPKFAELYAKGDMNALMQTAQRSAMMVTLLASPIFLLLMFGGHWVMALYGSGFEKGALILSIMAAGQMVNLMTGSVGYLLMMTGHERSFQNLTVLSALIMFVLSLILIPLLAGIGAALASAFSVAALNIGAVWMVRKKLGIWCVGGVSSLTSKAAK